MEKIGVILTGAPGTGKTTLLAALRRQGWRCIDEPARAVLAYERSRGGDGVPERNAARFVDLMLSQAVRTHGEAMFQPPPVFFDRGVPDLIVYAEHFGLDAGPYRAAAERHRYQQRAFILAPWRTIYVNDDERKMPFELADDFDAALRRVYAELGYVLVDVPLVPVAERVAFVSQAAG
jgi:predicted ATPase